MDANKNLHGRTRIERITDFLNEVGMLRYTPRTGYQFLGSGQENVAEHSYRTSIIGYVLAKLADVDVAKVTFLCLFHDLHEARTGDFNYVNHIYNNTQARRALEDATQGTGLAADILPMWDELKQGTTQEALLAHDADQLDLIFNLKAESDKGNTFADAWLASAVQRLKTPQGKELAETVLRTDHNLWWYAGPDRSWWDNRKG